MKRIWKEAIDDEVEWIWKEGFVPLSKYYHYIFPGEDFGKPRITSVKTADVPTKARTQDLWNTNIESYRYAYPLGNIM
jgi:hypothetical protein